MRASPLPSRALLSRGEWRTLGVSTSRMAGDDLVTVFPRFLTPAAEPATLNEMCRVLQQHVLPGAVISHTTAALLYGIPIPWWEDREIGLLADGAARSGARHLVIPSTLPVPEKPGAAPSEPRRFERLTTPPLLQCRVEAASPHRAGPHVVVHRKAPSPTFTLGGLKLSHPNVVLLELATSLEHDEIVIALDAFEKRRPRFPFRGVTLERLARELARCDGMPGIPALRRALLDARPNTDSPGETRTRLLLRRAGFPEPALNLRVMDPDTGRPRYIDLAYPELRIGVEYDGDGHRVTKDQWRQDQGRQDTLESAGWMIRRLTSWDIAKPERFLSALRRSFLAVGALAPSARNWTGIAAEKLARPLRRP
ncbi:endonuclease domain-containing protein [Brachybacterium sacelli]|uniref:DUF559 domain-containing protein n=1 Tax=Brachybacterium sacelli TaxID=173364 RepID=A0ABS4WVL8_9MICO|nr:hypothetical protein [Brachybacterium sacelli]MBP2380248.1 hypothetical protein [Brachybacterium sacelli]